MLAFLRGPGSRLAHVPVLLGGHGPRGRGPADGGRRLRPALRPGRGSGSERRGGRAWELLRGRARAGGDCVRDRPGLQGLGLGTLLLAHLAEVAQDNGISVFTAEVMPENHRMIEVFRESGFPVEMSSRPGTIHVELPTSLSDEAVSHFEDRDRIAAQAAIRPFLEPRAVAVIGASREHGTVGGQLFHNALEAGFEGVVYPVNPSADVVQSVRAYPSVTEVPDEVDLAVIAVPAPAVIDVARECADKGVPALVVISAGFAETGPDGAELQDRLVEVCGTAGMRLVGPNCLGILNTAEHAQLNVTFAPATPPARRRRLRHPERGAGPGADRPGQRPRPRRLLVRLDREPRRHHRQRLPRVLGGGRRHTRRAAVHRVLQRSPALLAGRSAARAPDADRGREERAFGGRRARDRLPHRRAARGLRRDGGRPLRAGGGDPHGQPGGAPRRRRAAREPAAAGRPAGRDHHQRGRARDHVRGRLRGGRARGPRATRRHAGPAGRAPSRRGGAAQPGGHDRHRHRRALPRDDPRPRRLGRDRCPDRDLHPPPAHPGRGRRDRDPRGGRGDAPGDPGAGGVHVTSGPRGDLGRRGPHTPLSRGRGSHARPGDASRRLARSPGRGARRLRGRPRRRGGGTDRRRARVRERMDGARTDGPTPRLLPDRDPTLAGGRRSRGGRPGRRRARWTGRSQGAGTGAGPQDRDGRRAHRALRRRAR